MPGHHETRRRPNLFLWASNRLRECAPKRDHLLVDQLLGDDCTVESGSPEGLTVSRSAMMDEFGDSKLLSLGIFPGGIIKIRGEKTARHVITENTGLLGSVCFVVRKPGSSLCRESGWELNAMTTLMNKPLDGFGLFGVVKESSTNDDRLSKFHSFFPFPLYRDDNRVFYRMLRMRRLGLEKPTYPATSTKKEKSKQRRRKKNSSCSLGSTVLPQGGVILFGPDLNPIHVYAENELKEIPFDDLLRRLDKIRSVHLMGKKR